MPFRFPQAKFVSNSIPRQLWHIAGEVYEVAKALLRRDWQHAAVECYDVIHAVETLLRILAKRKGAKLEEAKTLVLRKNTGRGYYEIYKGINS